MQQPLDNEDIKIEDDMEGAKNLFAILMIAIVGLIIYAILKPDDGEIAIKETIAAFDGNRELICREGSILNSKSLLVSKKRGWEIYREYFKRDDVLLDIAVCSIDSKKK